MKIEYCYYMLAIANAKSISKAAENLNLSQPYLSIELKSLEAKIKTSLILRTNRGVSLTAAGEKFVTYAKECVEIFQKMTMLSTEEETKPLVINSFYSFTMLDLFHTFTSMHQSQNSIIYEELQSKDIIEKVGKKETDLGIVYLFSNIYEKTLSILKSKNITFKPLIAEHLCIAVSKHHPLATKKFVTQEELKPYELLLEPRKIPPKYILAKDNPIQNMAQNFTLKPINFDNTRSLIYYISKDSSCFTIGQKFHNFANPLLLSGEITYIPIHDLDNLYITGYIMHDENHPSPIQEKFMKFVTNFFVKQSEQEKNHFSLTSN